MNNMRSDRSSSLDTPFDQEAQRENELRYACLRNRVDIIRRLSKLNVNIEAEDAHCTTPLMLACYYGHYDVVYELLSNPHVRIDHADVHGLHPLHLACEQQHQSIVELLLKHEADLHSQTTNGWTPLHFAADSNHFDLIKLLLLKGADKALPDRHGQTPMDIASRHNTPDIMRLFEATSEYDIERVLNPNSTASRGLKSHIHRHSRSGHTDDYTVELERERIMRGEISTLKLKLHELRHENGSKMDKLVERIDSVEDNVKNIMYSSNTNNNQLNRKGLVHRTGAFSPPLNPLRVGIPKRTKIGQNRVSRLKSRKKESIKSSNQLDLNDTDLETNTLGRSSLAPSSHHQGGITINLSTDYGQSEFGDDSEFNTGHIRLRPEAHSLELGGESDLDQFKRVHSPMESGSTGIQYLTGYTMANRKTSTVVTPMTATSKHEMSPIREEDFPHGQVDNHFDLGISSVEHSPLPSKRKKVSTTKSSEVNDGKTVGNDKGNAVDALMPRQNTKLEQHYKSSPAGSGALSPTMATNAMSMIPDNQTYEYNRYTTKTSKNRRRPRRKLFDIENHQRSQYDAEAEESDSGPDLDLFPDTAQMSALKGPRRSQIPHIKDENSITYPAIDGTTALRDRTSFKTADTQTSVLTDTEKLITQEEYANYVAFGDSKAKSKSRGTVNHKSGNKIALNLSIPLHRGDRDRGNKLSSIPDTIGMIGDGKISPNTVNAVVRDTQQHFPQYRGYADYGRTATSAATTNNKNQSPSPSAPQKRSVSPMSMSSYGKSKSIGSTTSSQGNRSGDLLKPTTTTITTHGRSKSARKRTLFSKGTSPSIPFNKTNVKVAVSTLASTAAAAVAASSSRGASPGYALGASSNGSVSPNVNWSKRPTQKLYNHHSKMQSEPAQIYANLRNRQRNGSIQYGSSGRSGLDKNGGTKKVSSRKKKLKTFSNGINGIYSTNY